MKSILQLRQRTVLGFLLLWSSSPLCLHAQSSYAVNDVSILQNVTQVNVNKPETISLKDLLMQLEKQYQFRFVYDDAAIRGEKISVAILHESADELIASLTKLLKDEGLMLSEIGNQQYGITRLENPLYNSNTLPLSKALEQIHLSGMVKDNSGNPLAGVTIKVESSDIGTITDDKGNYSIDVPDNAILVVSYLGYQTQKIPTKGRTSINVSLIPTATELNQLVVIGYGSKKKGNLTGAVSSVNLDNIKSRPVVNSMEALQGRLPGVTITSQSGEPGREDYQLNIRGISSINGTAPLVLINGVPGDINSINPTDIENVTVLRDAAASIYGARAADGVILVTTKTGKSSGHPEVSYSYNISFNHPHYLKKTTTTSQFVAMFNQANLNDGDPQTFSDETIKKVAANDPGIGPGENWSLTSYPMFYQNHNWYKSLFKTSETQTHNLSISGGTQSTTYRISAGYLHDNGIISTGTDHFNRYDLRMSFHTQITQGLSLDINSSYDNQKIFEPSELNDAIDNALKVFSYVPYRNPAGNWYTYQGYQNPFQELLEGGMRNSNSSMLSNNFKLDWEPIHGLVWTGQAAVNIGQNEDNAYYPTFYGYQWDNSISSLTRNLPNSAYDNQLNTIYNNYTTYLNYSLHIQKHQIHFMLGASKEKSQSKTVNVSGANFTNNEIFVLPLSDPKELSVGDYWANDPWDLVSYFGRASYSYKGKYYLDATFRKDGSSKFSPVTRWSEFYPSVSVAWKLSEEPFLRKFLQNNIIDLFKTRLSWGRAGNQDIPTLGLFDYIQQISVGGQYPIDGTTRSQSASLSGIAAPDRTWETIETKNLGFDLGLFQSKLAISFDIYQKKNTDMLVSVAYPSTLGAPAPTTNAGSLLNDGWELNGSWKSEIGRVQLQVGVIVNYNKNEVTNLQGNDTYNVGLTFARQGYPLNSYFGYKGTIIRTQKELEAYASKYAGKGIVPGTQPNGYKGLGIGDVMFQDISGDGEITPFGTNGHNGDVVFLGSQTPKYTFSSTVELHYKSFDFFMLLQGTGNKYIWRGNGNFGVPLSEFWFQPIGYFYGKTFSENNPNAPYPRLSNSSVVKTNNYQFSSIWLVNTRYLKIGNLTIGYTLPKINLSKYEIRNARIYFSGENILYFAKGTWDKEYNPEENSSEDNYPMYSTFSLGININF